MTYEDISSATSSGDTDSPKAEHRNERKVDTTDSEPKTSDEHTSVQVTLEET